MRRIAKRGGAEAGGFLSRREKGLGALVALGTFLLYLAQGNTVGPFIVSVSSDVKSAEILPGDILVVTHENGKIDNRRLSVLPGALTVTVVRGGESVRLCRQPNQSGCSFSAQFGERTAP